MILWFLLGMNAGMFACLLIQSDFKLKRFLELGKELVDKLEGEVKR